MRCEFGYVISIHALLAESDLRRSASIWLDKWNFYPRSPCGERPRQATQAASTPTGFLSTLSLRRATRRGLLANTSPGPNFYPRSPCGERPHIYQWQAAGTHFYPRSPCGERRYPELFDDLKVPFLSTLSLRRATVCIRSR